jgi:hypothetical protein
MAVTSGHEETLAPKPVSSTSSMETAGSWHLDGGRELTEYSGLTQQSLETPRISSDNLIGADHFGLVQNLQFSQPTHGLSSIANPSTSSISLVPRPNQLHISPSTGVMVPSSVPSTNTVPEFLYQLTKMLTENNRDVIEWSNGESPFLCLCLL